MNATAELASRWTTTTDAAASSSTSTPNGPQSLLTIDDSSSSNTFYGQHLGISLFDDSVGALANPGQLQQLINFSDLGGQLQQHQLHHPPHAPPSSSASQHQHHVVDPQEQGQPHVASTPPHTTAVQMVSSSTSANPTVMAAVQQQQQQLHHEQLQRQQQQQQQQHQHQQQHILQPGQTISFNGMIPPPGTIRSATTTTTTTTNGVQQIFLNQTQLQQHQQQILLQQQQQQLANNLVLLQQQQQQQQQLATQLQAAVNGGGLYNLQATTNSVSGQFKVEPITDAALCLQEHYRQQQQQIALQTQIQMQYQMQQQQQQQQQAQTTQLIDMNGMQQQFVQLPANYNLQQFQGMVMAMQQQQQQQQQQPQQRIVIMGADGRTYHAVNGLNGELEYVDEEEEEEEDGDQIMQQGQAQGDDEGEEEEECEETEESRLVAMNGEEMDEDHHQHHHHQQGTEEDELEEKPGDQMTVQLPMTNSSNHCDIINGGLGPGSGGLVIATTNGQPGGVAGGPGGAYQQIGFFDRATGRQVSAAAAQGLFNQQLMFQQAQQQQQRLVHGGGGGGIIAANGQLLNGDGSPAREIQIQIPGSTQATHLSQTPQINSITYQQILAEQQVPEQQQHSAQQQVQTLNAAIQQQQQQQQQQLSLKQQQGHAWMANSAGVGAVTGANAGKKIRPVLKPGLVLKTPIAFQGNVDPSQIPIQRDGMAVCERCGAIGVKHSFYTKFKSFCSLNCARNFEEEQLKKGQGAGGGAVNGRNSNNSNHKNLAGNQHVIKSEDQSRSGAVRERSVKAQFGRVGFRRRVRMMSYEAYNNSDEDSLHSDYLSKGGGDGGRTMSYHLYAGSGVGRDLSSDVLYRDLLPQEDLPELEDMPLMCPEEERIETVNRRKAPVDLQSSYDWTPVLNAGVVSAAPVTCFRHVPGYDIWSKVVVNMKVEVENTDCESGHQAAVGSVPHAFWVATVLQIQGYKALLRYEGFDDDASHDFWVNLCSSEVHNVGWCATRGKPLIPPKSIEGKYSDWKSFLMQRLYNARTLSSSFYNRLSESLKSRFRVGLQLEIVDKEMISQVRLATVDGVVGKRLHVRYNDNGDGFFCHEDSALIHHVGWATMVGHKIKAPADYLSKMVSLENGGKIEYDEDDATVDLFKMNFTYDEYRLEASGTRRTMFRRGMKLEAIDPLNPSSICVASVMSVLKYGYLMIRIDVYEPLVYGDDWFCYHETSPYIFPVGFCAENDLDLTPPKGYDAHSFNWDGYLNSTRSVAATPNMFKRDVPRHNFQLGMKIECADLMDPKLVCVATVSRIVGRLMRINFDGWEDVYDQWLDIESPDMYPVGWCFLVKHRLEGPKVAEKPGKAPVLKGKARNRKKLGKGEGKALIGVVKGGKGRARVKAIKLEPPDDLAMADEEKKLQHHHEESVARGIVGSEELQLLRESRRLGTLDLEEDSTSRLMGSSSLTDDGHAEEYSLSAVGGEELMLMEDEEEQEDQQQRHMADENYREVAEKAKKGKKKGLLSKKRTSVSSSSSASSKAQQKVAHRSGGEQEEMVGSSTSLMDMEETSPDLWSVAEVCAFLVDHDCAAHCECFKKHKVDGKRLLKMSKDDIITVLGMKVGPALKIFDLITQLKDRLDPFASLRRK